MNQKQIELRKAFLKLCLLEITGELWNEDGQYLTNGEKMINEKDYLRNEVCDYLKRWYL